MHDRQRIADALRASFERARATQEGLLVVGYGVGVLTGPDGAVKAAVPFENLVTDAGDAYYAAKAIVGVGPANPSAPSAANGMKLGTSATAVSKGGAGAALGSYLSGSNAVFTAGHAQINDLGAGLGDEAVYQSAWAAGVATHAAITEVVIVNDSGSNATSTGANTYHRALFASSIDKQAGDSLTVTWSAKFLGA